MVSKYGHRRTSNNTGLIQPNVVEKEQYQFVDADSHFGRKKRGESLLEAYSEKGVYDGDARNISSFSPFIVAPGSSSVSAPERGALSHGSQPMTEKTELEQLFLENDQSFIARFKRTAKKELQIAVLAPQDKSKQYSLQTILPPVTMAVSSERVRQLLPNWKIEVHHRDTKCSSTIGPLAAVEFYNNKTAGQ